MASTREKRSIESLDDIYREAIKTPDAANSTAQDALSEDFLGGDVYSADSSSDGAYGQVVMHSLAANDPSWHGKEIAVAADKMRVTIKVSGGKPISSYQLNHGLDQLGVSYGVNWQALVAIEALSNASKPGEVVVALGTAAESKRSVSFPDLQRGINLDGSFFWLVDGVKLNGSKLRAMLAEETLAQVEKSALPVKAVAKGTTLAMILQNPAAKAGTNVMGEIIEPIDDILPERGENVIHNEAAGTYEAAMYGYLVLEDNTMSVLPTIWLPPDHLSAYYINAAQIGQPVLPSANDLMQSLLALQIGERVIRRSIIDKLAERLQQGQELSVKTVKIAEAITPRPGHDAQFVFCPELGNKTNTLKMDGTIDLSEREAIASISHGTLIAEKTMATKGSPGADLFGEALPAADGLDQTLLVDDMVRIEERGGQLFYYAQKTGNLRFAGNRLTIADLYTVAGNVDSSTGNLDRPEDLQINGSVLAGCTVRSPGNIMIKGSVYNGAKVFAGGDLTVGEGITGAETRVVALGHLQAVFIQESEVIIKGNALVRGYLYNAVLRANGTITVVNNEQHGHKSGRIIGGLTCASKGILVSRVGHPSQSGTVLAILPDPEFSGQLKKLDDEGKNCRDSIARIARTLPFNNFDATTIKRVLAQLPAEKRDPVIRLLTTFNNLIKRQQNIEALRKEITSKMMSSLRNGTIQILQDICQGSELQFGEKKIVLAADQAGATFTLQGGEIV